MANEKPNKVTYGDRVLIDLTDSTVNPNVLLAGYKAYDASGNAITGEFSPSYHITLTQAQYDQLSQTEKMADENFFYITDATVVGVDIDDTTTSTIKVWSSSKVSAELSAKANSADVPTKAQITNPNLLDNPWFTINQRGVSSFSTNGYSLVDRWSNNRAEGTISENGLTFAKRSIETSVGYIYQRIENYSEIVGKTVTFSAIIDGNLYSVTGVFPVKNGAFLTKQILVNGDTMQLRIEFGSVASPITYPWCLIWNDSYNSHTIKAVKLEIGSVSTLAMDTAPNFQQELAKCQRYFQRHVQNSNISLIGYALPNSSGNLLTTSVRLFVPMRTIPAVSVSAVTDFYYGNHTSYTSMTEQPTSITRNGGTYQDVSVAFGGMTGLTVGQLFALAGKGYIDFTADL